jgi:hypothetical protein
MNSAGRRRTWSEWQQTSRGALVCVVQDGVDAAAAYSVRRVEPAQKQQQQTTLHYTTHYTNNESTAGRG